MASTYLSSRALFLLIDEHALLLTAEALISVHVRALGKEKERKGGNGGAMHGEIESQRLTTPSPGGGEIAVPITCAGRINIAAVSDGRRGHVSILAKCFGALLVARFAFTYGLAQALKRLLVRAPT